MEKEIANLIYNQKDVCDVFHSAGLEAALKAINEKRNKLISYTEENPFADRMESRSYKPDEEKILAQKKLLNSLNENLYYYVLYVISPEEEEFVYRSYTYKYAYGEINSGMFTEYATRILEMYKKYIHPEENSNKRIEEACRYIKNHLSEELTLEKVASKIYIGRCHLCWLFNNCKQINFSEYVTEERLKLAKHLLYNKSLSIDSVAEKCGFSSSSYFSTVFKKKIGITPRDYRKKYTMMFYAQ